MADHVEPARGRLAAVMFLDIVGYSAMMSEDERSALAAVHDFETIVRAQVEASGGRLVKFLGDGSLAEFPSTRAAVGCALAIQSAVALRTGGSDGPRFQVRAGVHSGDLVERGDDVFGDAVNIAARIHPLADPGGLALSGPVYDQVRTNMRLRGIRVRGVRLKNIPAKQEVFLVAPPGAAFMTWYLGRRRRPIGIALALALALLGGVWGWRRMAMRPVEINLEATFNHAFAGGGATLYVESRDATSITVRYQGSGLPGAPEYCGFVLSGKEELLGKDWRKFSGLSMRVRGSASVGRRVNILLVEAGAKGAPEDGENWEVAVEVERDEADLLLPFAQFQPSEYQPGGRNGVGVLDLHRMFKVTVQPAISGTEMLTLTLRDLRLLPARRSRPPRFRDPISGAATIEAGQAVTYLIPAEDPDDDPVQCRVDWGDGEQSVVAYQLVEEPIAVTHRWNRPGRFAVRAKLFDSQGQASDWSPPWEVQVGIASGILFDDFEVAGIWYSYGVQGAEVRLTNVPGRTGSALQLTVVRNGVWGLERQYDAGQFGDASQFSGIRFWARGTPGQDLRLNVNEMAKAGPDNGESWGTALKLTDEWREFHIPFASLQVSPWQPDTADKNGRLDLAKWKSISLTNAEGSKAVEFTVDDFWLVAGVRPAAAK